MQENGRFTTEEFAAAGIGGVGITLMITGGLLLGVGTVEESTSNTLVVFGFLVLAVATALWMFWTRPWRDYDDLTTPHYTGHHHDDHHDHHEETVAELAIEQDIPASPAEKVAVADDVSTSTSDAVVEEVAADAQAAVDVVEEVTPETEVKAVVEEAVSEVEEVTLEKQVLTVIEGVGPKTQEALYAEGVKTYKQVAALSGDELEHLVKVKQGVRVISGTSQTWPKQAQYLVDGDEEGLQAYQDTLKGGREVD